MNDSYLTIDTGSLTSKTFKSTISRGEYIYMLMNHYFKEDLSTVDTKSASLSDANDAGDLSTTKAFEKYDGSKDCWQTAELANAIANPDDGCPTRMYKALVLANTLDIVNAETRWDEGLSRSEAIELLADTYAKLAEVKGYPVDATLGKTDLPTVDVVAEENTENTETTPEATESKSEINENDSQTSEGEVYEEVTETPAPDTSSNTGYTLDEESKAFLKQMGATDAELNNVKSDKDLDNLINNLSSRLYGNGGGSSNAGGSSSSASGDFTVDPSERGETPKLGSGDTVQGSM